MIVSTRGRYALRVMIDLAEHRNEGYIPLKEISERQEISLKYLEGITSSLSKAGLVTGVSGKGGGYALAVDPTGLHGKIGFVRNRRKTQFGSMPCLRYKRLPARG